MVCGRAADAQRRLIFSPKSTSATAHPPELWKWKTSRRPGRPRLKWADMTLREAEQLAEDESLPTHDLLSEMSDSNFCKVVFGRSRGATRAFIVPDIMNE